MKLVVPLGSASNIVRIFLVDILQDPVIPVFASVHDMPTWNTLAQKALARSHEKM